MTKVGLPGAKEGWQKTDVTNPTVLKSQGYATGQFGKNYQGDRDEHLPTMHGFDEFLGNLYPLNAQEDPENLDYPKNPEFRKKYAMPYSDWKVVFLENRGEAFGVWREPFVELRVPLLFNLRRDPFERAQHNSNTYNDWFLDRAFVVVPLQGLAANFLMTMKDYPPSQTPGSFNLEKIQKQIESAIGGK